MFGWLSLRNRVERLESEVASIRQLYDKTREYSASDPRSALMNARLAAEAVCARVFEDQLGESPKGLTLQTLIQRLTQKKVMPEQILIALATIQRYGNFGVHHQPGEAQTITPEFAQPCLQALGQVVQWYFDEYRAGSTAGGTSIHQTNAAPPSRFTRRALVAGLAGIAAVSLLTFIAARDWPQRLALSAGTQASTGAPIPPHASRIAILPFESLSSKDGDTSGYEEGIVRILEKPLKASPDLDMVERADIDKAIGELKLTRDRMFDQSTVSRIGRLVGAQRLVLGSYFRIGKNLRIDARIVDTETGRILSSVAREGEPEDLTALVTAIGEELVASQTSPAE